MKFNLYLQVPMLTN